MRAIATVSMSGDLRSKLEAIARAGYDGVEIFENDLLSFDGSPGELRELCQRLELEVVAFQPFRDFEAMPEPQRSRNFQRAERKFELMETLGAEFLLVCSNVSPHCIDDLDQAAADLRELAEKAHARGLRIGFEALAWGRHISDYRDAWEVVKRADHPALGVVLDSFHILSLGLELDTMAALPRDKIAFVQIADAPVLDMDVLQWSRHFRCFPGQGRLPLTAFMQALAHTGYDGPLSLEIFNDAFRAAPAEATARDGVRSLIWLEQLAEGAAWSHPAPAAVDYSGVHFIEFTLDEDSAAPLGQFISALGFRHIGRHRSKNVELWRQDDINLVLNFETDSFAHTFRLLHGISVCAVGFRVGDLDSAIERAESYNASLFRGPVGPGEMEIPALRGIEGSLVYLVDDDQASDEWQTDFNLFADDQQVNDAGLLRIDHLTYVLSSTQLLSWLLYHRTVFGFDGGSEHEIADPRGLVLSQAVTSPNGAIRIPLNASSARDTLPGRFLSEHQGGVQQIAFATRQIFDTVDALYARGVPILRIPDNYYDDLGARYPLDDDLLEAMRQRNILYDQNEDGAFLHVYTEMFMGRFFFEIVERRGNYAQFGAVNASIRLAAQAGQQR